MINYIKRKDLDIIKYDACIENAIQSRIYAFSWYLDIVADNWDVLVLDDYKAVMPIPWNSKYGLKYITQPYFCQQLGFFSDEKLSIEIQRELIKKIPRKFIKVSIQLNSDNYFESDKMLKKDNYILALNNSTEALISNFNNNRKRNLKKALSALLIIDENLTANDFFKFYLLNDKNYQIYNSIKNVLHNILEFKNGSIKLYGIRKDGNLIACVLLLIDRKRITYLAPVSNDLARENGAATFLISEIIKKYQNSDYILDFEGSMITGVASFYKGFGAKLEEYMLIKFNRLPSFVKLFKP